MIKGFLFGFGLLFGFAAFIFFLILILKLTKKKAHHAPAKDWKMYLEQVLKAEDFAEAKFVTELIINKDDDEEIKTPPDYRIEVKRDFEVHESDNGEKSKIGFVKKYKIIKNKKMRLDKDFFDEVKLSCPKAHERFLKWIDEYKAEVGWGALFHDRIKFHDLPIEMQMGIIERFDDDQFISKSQRQKIILSDMESIRSSFAFIENEINRQQNAGI